MGQLVIPEAGLSGWCQWCQPGHSWCEYHASDPSLARYVRAGAEGWAMLAEADEEARAQRKRQEEEAQGRRRLQAQSFGVA